MTDNLHSFSSLCPIMFDYICTRKWLNLQETLHLVQLTPRLELEIPSINCCSNSFGKLWKRTRNRCQALLFMISLCLLSSVSSHPLHWLHLLWSLCLSLSLNGWILQGWVGAVLLSADGLNMDGFWRCILLVQLCH